MSAVYPDMLENFVFPQAVAEVDGLLIQRDGAPAHFGAIVHTSLNERFPGGWIGRGGPINWPDLTPMDFFLWRYVTDVVHSGMMMKSLPDLRQRITSDIAVVPVDVLSRVWDEVEFRFDVCGSVSGAHIELH
jgi:hypothetical protein